MKKAAGLDLHGWMALVFAAVAGTQPLRSFDLFWHLATGRYIVASRALPVTDPFRFTSNHAPWVDHSWLSQLLFHGIERALGLNALVVFGTLVTVAIAAILLAWMRHRLLPSVAASIVVLAIFGARPRLMLRPELLSLLFVAILIPALERFAARRTWKAAAILAVLVAIWANFHPGALVAPLIAGAYLLGCKLQRRDRRPSADDALSWTQVVAVPALLAAAALATPAGFEIYALPFRIQRALAGLPVVNPEWLPVWQGAWQAYAAGVVLLIACFVWAAAMGARIDLPGLFLGILLVGLAASGARHQGIFFVGAAFVAARAVAPMFRERPSTTDPSLPSFDWPARRATRFALPWAAIVVPAFLTLWCFSPPETSLLRARQPAVVPGFGIEAGLFPEAAVRALQQHREIGALYNDVAFGGYLLWRLYPERQVFWDGRNEVDPALLREGTMARGNEKAWVALLDRFEVDAALVHYREGKWRVVPPSGTAGAPVYRTASQIHFPRDRFALVQWDDAGMLFVRRTEAIANWLASAELKQVHPEAIDETVAEAASSPAHLKAALAELDLREREFGPSQRADSIRAELLRTATETAR